jgi:photosystem II stability/assembly factor-like uncharacterized protein
MKLLATALLFLLIGHHCLAQTGWQRIDPGSSAYNKGVHFISDRRGYVCGDGPTLRGTVNGGITWDNYTVPTTSGLWGVYTAGSQADTVFVAGDDGAVLRSIDHGATWTTQDAGYSKGLCFGLSGYDGHTLCMTGGEGDFGSTVGVIVTTHDAGEHWNKVTIPGTYSFDKSFFTSAMVGYAAGSTTASFSQGVIYKTIDGGATWNKLTTTTAAMNSIHCFSNDTMIAVGFKGLVTRSTNGGTTWTPMQVPAAQAADAFTHVSFVDASNGYITDAAGAILKSTDGGVTWTNDATFNFPGTVMWTMAVARGAGGTFVYAVGDAGAKVRVKIEVQAPTATTSATSLDFGKVATGSKEMSFTIAAENALGLRIDEISLADPKHGFSIVSPTGPFPMNITQGNPLAVTIRYTQNADDTINVTSQVRIRTNAPASETIIVSVIARQANNNPAPGAIIDATSLEFGKVQAGTTTDLTITLAAANSSGLRLDSISIRDEIIPGTFRIVEPAGPFPITVQMGQPLSIKVRFAPTTAAVADANLFITTNAKEEPLLYVPLSGEGTPAVASTPDDNGHGTALQLTATPNPIVNSGIISVVIPSRGDISLTLTDPLGRTVRTIYNGTSDAGQRWFSFDAGSLPTGVYYCTLQTPTERTTGSIIVAR